MKLKVYITLLFCWVCMGISFAQVTKTLHQTFTLDAAEKVNINVVAKSVEMKETNGSRILVETKVMISLPNARLLDFVCNSGRYDLIKRMDETTRELTIASKKTNDILIIKGEECVEILEYVIYMPTSVKFANNSTLVDGKE
ncbi:MAG: Unknown protein [uncultured Aureispira sp.]|uniref:Auto-transporter adhesin head GIN domain-containing protein n=1 Tax=uncultured Aureispira sp. TaxID=1331704 RepID=A0A6S6SI56_9BACT|nr:MAG: Unknown protein [uncultured Aureispira sp.]